MDPDFKTAAEKVNMQGVYGPTPPPGVQQPNFQPIKPLKKSKKSFILVGAVAAALVIVIIIVLALPQGKKKQPTQTDDPNAPHTEAQGPQPATAVTTEQANNAISQEIGNLNDERDFPTDQLTDDTLGF